MHPHRSPAPTAVAGVGLLVLVLGVWGNWWFKGEPTVDEERDRYMDMSDMGMEFDIGLREMSTCARGVCATAKLDALAMMFGDFGGFDDDEDEDDEKAAAREKLKKYRWAAGVTFWAGIVCACALALSILLWMLR